MDDRALILKIRKYENLHILMWLIKDSCWLLELKVAGTVMILPAVFLAVHILIKTRRSAEGLINASVLCWIAANSYWMLIEFYFEDRLRGWAAVPFVLGLLFVALYFLRENSTAVKNSAPLPRDSGMDGEKTA